MSSGMWNRTLIYLGLKEEPEDDYDGATEQFVPEDDPYAEHAEPRPTAAHRRAEPSAAGEPHPSRLREPDDTVRPLRGAPGPGDVHVRAVPSVTAARAAVVEISGFEDVPAIGSRYRTGQAVLFDLSRASAADARRVVDFVSGLTYALRGRLTKVGGRAFLLVPDGVHLPAEERRRLDDLGYRISASAEG